MSDTQDTLHQAILEYLKREGGTGYLAISADLDLNPYDVARALQELKRQGLVRRGFPPWWGLSNLDVAETLHARVD